MTIDSWTAQVLKISGDPALADVILSEAKKTSRDCGYSLTYLLDGALQDLASGKSTEEVVGRIWSIRSVGEPIMKPKMTISFGALSESIHEQLKKQGYDIPIDELTVAQQDADAITRVRVRGLITNPVFINRAERKVVQMVWEVVLNRYTQA